MTLVSFPLIAEFSTDYTGHAADLTASLYDSAGQAVNPGTLTWAEELDAAGNAVTGAYHATAQLSTAWAYPLCVVVGITGQAGIVSTDRIKALDIMGSLVVTLPTTPPTGYGVVVIEPVFSPGEVISPVFGTRGA